MKKAVLIIYFISFYAVAQTLHTDKLGVKVFYEIQQTERSVYCKFYEGSDKKINIWKVIVGIENGHHEAIVPRGVGIANITVNPIPLKPYSNDYCSYDKVKNYEPTHGNIEQSIFSWTIRDYLVDEIKPGEVLINTTYLYLYEGQTPTLKNWQFLGYRLKKDFNDYDALLAYKNDDTTVVKSLENMNITFNTQQVESELPSDVALAKIKKVKVLESIAIEEIQNVDSIKTSSIEKETSNNTTEENSTNYDNEIKTPPNSKPKDVVTKCPGVKALEYKNKPSSNTTEQRAYSLLALYYTYKCECEMGSPRSESLVNMINNVADSYTYNTNDAYGKISKVSKCKPPIAIAESE